MKKIKMKQKATTPRSLLPTPSLLIAHCSLLIALCSLLFASCSFDYGDEEGADKNLPDIVMENVEYVRMRSADPQARFMAELVERYEERRIMELRNFSFEQFGNGSEEVSAFGRAGSASIEMDSMDMRLDNGVRIDVESEDLAIETQWLQWKDEIRTLTGGKEDEVNIYQENGTAFTGTGFHADARRRAWEFSGGVSGTYVKDDDEEEENTETKEESDEDALAEAETAEAIPFNEDSV